MQIWRTFLHLGSRQIPVSLYHSPWHLLLILILSIFVAITATMAILYTSLPFPVPLMVVKDLRLLVFGLVPGIMITSLFPALVFCVLRPLRSNIAERQKAEEELRSSREQLRRLSYHLQAAREEERTRIAREIHDELGQVLATLALKISWLESDLPVEDEELRQKTAAMAELVRSTIKTVQRVSSELRPVMLDDLGLADAVQWHVGEFQKKTGIECDLQVDLNGDGPDRERSTAVFRILQETLTNVLRHARATRIKVRLAEKPDRLLLQVSDNGRGIAREEITNRHSLGILGMRERAGFWGGKVKIRGLRQGGTVVRVIIPGENTMPPQEKVVFPEFTWAGATSSAHQVAI